MKRPIALLISLILILSTLPLSAIKVSASPFAGGDGSAGNPYLVASPEALNAVRDYPKAHYMQTADIDMSAWGNWIPIPRFEGTYDGGNHSIINFSINDNNFQISKVNDTIGLFSYLCNAKVKNIRMEALNIHFDLSNHDYVPTSSVLIGGLAGTADATVIENCSVSGSITVKNCSYLDIGGLVGSLNKGSSYSSAEQCRSSCNITVISNKDTPDAGKYLFCGGIIGDAICNYLTDCFNSGNINIQTEGHGYVGGIIGSTSQKTSFTSCVNTGNIKSNIGCNGFVGGISGRSTAGGLNDTNNYIQCSNSGSISVSVEDTAYIGGIVGRLESNNGRSSRGAVTNSQNVGSISASVKSANPEAYIGGIVGWLKACATYNVNYGKVSLTSQKSANSQIYVGGICGKESWPEKIESGGDILYYFRDCYNLADEISATEINAPMSYTSDNVGRIIGNDSGSTQCYSYKEALVNGAIRYGSLPTDKNGGDLTEEELLKEGNYNLEFYPKSDKWVMDKTIGGPLLYNVPISSNPIIPDDIKGTDFNDLIYRANHLTSGNSNILTDIATYNLLLTSNFSPSQIIVDAHPENMHTMAAAWEALKATVDAADGEASQVLKQNAKQEDLITAYILGAVGVYTELQYVDAVEKNFKRTQNIVDFFYDLNSDYVVGGHEFREFIKGKDGEINDLLRDYYSKNDPTMSALLKTKNGMSVIDAVISKANSIEDVVSEISSYSKLYSINESAKEALLLMYELCPEESKELKNALKLTAEIVSSANAEMIKDIAEREFAFGICREAAYTVTDKVWGYMTDAFVDKCPVAKGYVELAKMQLTVMDKFFGIDARTEQYFKLCTLNEVDRVAGLAVHQAMNNYKEDPSGENADVFLAAIELKFGFVDQSYSESIKYSEIITDSGIIQKMENGFRDLFNVENVNVLKESLLKAQKANDLLHCTLLTSWISALDAEDHNIAETYYQYREAMYIRYQPESADDFNDSFRNAAKQYSIHCPVNVKIYNASGETVAEVGENAIIACDNIAVIYDHGEKEIYFFDNADYTLVCEGYEDGDMDIELKEFNSDGALVRTVGYNNVPVSPGSVHTLSKEKLEDGDGATIFADFDSAKDSEKYKITIKNGTISDYLFEYEASEGERIEICAIVPEGYRFVGWLGDVKFEDAKSSSTYFFMKDGDVSVSAKLKKLESEDDDSETPDSTTIIVIVIIAGAALITVAVITIFIVISKGKKNSKKE